jgi:hypothetical protein
MAPKKITEKSHDQSNMYVVLRDNKNSGFRVVPHDKLLYAKKDNLKPGTFAMYYEDGNLSAPFHGTVIMSGKLRKLICSINVYYSYLQERKNNVRIVYC